MKRTQTRASFYAKLSTRLLECSLRDVNKTLASGGAGHDDIERARALRGELGKRYERGEPRPLDI